MKKNLQSKLIVSSVYRACFVTRGKLQKSLSEQIQVSMDKINWRKDVYVVQNQIIISISLQMQMKKRRKIKKSKIHRKNTMRKNWKAYELH